MTKQRLALFVWIAACIALMGTYVWLNNHRTTETQVLYFEQRDEYLVRNVTKNGFGEILYEDNYWLEEPEL